MSWLILSPLLSMLSCQIRKNLDSLYFSLNTQLVDIFWNYFNCTVIERFDPLICHISKNQRKYSNWNEQWARAIRATLNRTFYECPSKFCFFFIIAEKEILIFCTNT
ncbi:hypothetical protein HZS_1375 [Henneguya salminicola]|nr:hypothetical protein HZS_1375 [Henneguya salminicola]